eukprot:GSChrysophyteH1.ASY1.ANO1.1427.1 assembled CDS
MSGVQVYIPPVEAATGEAYAGSGGSGVYLIRLSSPPLNILNSKARSLLLRDLKHAENTASAKIILLVGSEIAFSVGADITEMNTRIGNSESSKAAAMQAYVDAYRHNNLASIVYALDSCPKPVVALITGQCFGGGLELALGCHYRICSKDAKFRFPETLLGILPGALGTQLLPRLVPFHEAGLVDQILSDTEEEQSYVARSVRLLQKHLQRVGDKPVSEAPSPFRRTSARRVVTSGRANQETLRMESLISRSLVVSEEAQALRWMFFAEKNTSKKPWTSDFSVGIVGAGTMGSGIASSLLMAGLGVVLCDSSTQSLSKGKDTIEKILQNSKRKGRVKGPVGTLKTVSELKLLKACHFVIEAVFEDMKLKKKIFAQLDHLCDKDTILCSNTSSLDVDALARETRRPDKVMGLHFFSPAHIMRLVEVVRCRATSPATMSLGMQLVKKIHKIGVSVTNLPGFVGNRMIFVYATEALLLLEDGASVSHVDQIMKSFGMAMGPFEMSDLSGLDVGYKIRLGKGLIRENGEVVDNLQQSYSSIADVLYLRGRMGAKNGLGFYKYVPNPKGRGRYIAQTDTAIEKAASAKATSGIYPTSVITGNTAGINDMEIQERLLYSLVNEGFRILGEHGCVHDRPSDIDVIYVHGYGFPAYKGGPMFWVDFSVGLRTLHESLQKYYQKYPKSVWFEPAPLLTRMIQNNVSLWQLQENPSLVKKLMSLPERPLTHGDQSKL